MKIINLIIVIAFAVVLSPPTIGQTVESKNPCLLVIPDINSSQLTAYGRYYAREIIEQLKNKSCNIKNASQLQRLHDELRSTMNSNSMEQNIVTLAKKYDVNLILIIDGSSQISGYDKANKKYNAKGSVSGILYGGATGKKIYEGKSGFENGSGTTEREAIQNTLKNAVQAFVIKLYQHIN